MTSADPLLAIAEDLYAGLPAAFTAARDAASKSAADKVLGSRIKSLRKPSTAAWAVNLLVRREAEQIDQVLALGASLRDAAAAMDGAELRALTRQRRQLTMALTTRARALARESGARLTESVADQVEGVLTAAMLDPVAAEAVRSGLLVTSFSSTGVSDLDLAQVLAIPDAMGVRATAVSEPEAAEPARVGLHVVPEDDALRRERAEDALELAETALAGAARELADAEGAVTGWAAKRLQVQDELDELRRRVAELEGEADRVEEELEEAESVRDDAAEAVAVAQGARDAAQRALEAFDR